MKKPLLVATVGIGLLGLTGCHLETKGFFAQNEMMRHSRKTLQVPILNNLSKEIDEPNEEFPNASELLASDLQVDSSDYVIGRNDLLSIQLQDVTPGVETVKNTRVSESGNISLPLIGQLQAAGLTEASLEQRIRDKYQEQGIVKNATVSVTVLEARQRTFSIRGAVNRPGQYAIVQSDFRVLDALVLAGDVQITTIDYCYIIRRPSEQKPTTQPATPAQAGKTSPDALEPKKPAKPAGPDVLEPKKDGEKGAAPAPGTTLEDATKTAEKPPVYVDGQRKVDAAAPADTEKKPEAAGESKDKFEFNNPLPADTSRIIRIPLRHLLLGDLRFNAVIRPNDTLVVPTPEVGEYYMGGHVTRVGVYSLTGRNITLKQAIISAGMLDELGVPRRTEVIRRIGRDREVFVRVNLAKVWRGEQPDFFLKPYDVVQVGTEAWVPFIAAVRNAFRITYGFGFLYDRNFYTGRGSTG